jgi:hypothetical protein
MSTSSADSTHFLTNREFSDEGKTYIQKLLLQTMDELRDVGEQITRLMCRQAELESDISQYKVALAPHKMLPEYILQLIFQWCIPPDGLCVPNLDPHDRELACQPPFTQVCSSWRKLAMNTPELWRDVRVVLPCDYDCYSGCRINLAHGWLSHAGDMLRSLKITAQESEKWCSEAVDRLVPPFRFRSLDLALTRGQFRRLLSLPPQMQSLHSLRLGMAGAWSPHPVYEDFSAYSLITTLPWSQLRHLHIDGASISASTLINALGNCLVLEELWMILCPDPAPCDAPASFITLPNLQQLTLRFVTGSNSEMFFRSLILPQIEELNIGMTDLHTEMPGCTSLHFANMAQRSGMSRIKNLFLDKGAEPHRLADLLKYTPSLSFLSADGDVVFDDQTLEDMSTGQLGPNIKNLCLPDVGDGLRIFEMVWTRFQNAEKSEVSVTPIMRVEVSARDAAIGRMADVRGWVNKLEDLGVYCVTCIW